MNRILKIQEQDNVGTCLSPLLSGEKVLLGEYTLLVVENIPKFHKIALTDIPKKSPIYKYGQIIGLATKDIPSGGHVHVQNIESLRGRGDKEGAL